MDSLINSIAPARALGITVASWANGRVELSAPLKPSLNDKGTAFAGSIDSMLDLAGWCAITLALREAGIDAEVMIVKSETRYTAAVRSDLEAAAGITESEVQHMITELNDRGRSRLSVQSQLMSAGEECASMVAHYAIILKGRSTEENA